MNTDENLWKYCKMRNKEKKTRKKYKNNLVSRNIHPPAAAACRQVLPKSSGVSMTNPAQICNQHQFGCQPGYSTGEEGVSMNVPEDTSFLQQSEKPLRAARCKGNIPWMPLLKRQRRQAVTGHEESGVKACIEWDNTQMVKCQLLQTWQCWLRVWWVLWWWAHGHSGRQCEGQCFCTCLHSRSQLLCMQKEEVLVYVPG